MLFSCSTIKSMPSPQTIMPTQPHQIFARSTPGYRLYGETLFSSQHHSTSSLFAHKTFLTFSSHSSSFNFYTSFSIQQTSQWHHQRQHIRTLSKLLPTSLALTRLQSWCMTPRQAPFQHSRARQETTLKVKQLSLTLPSLFRLAALSR